ncbi:MAG: hypothetical protein FH753_04895 [Firmicutes bacterium]|nr:hypothetical protein [Bacillota bacterium]
MKGINLSKISEIRHRIRDDEYSLTLEIPEDIYYSSYKKINKDIACDIIEFYLKKRHDIGKPHDTHIDHIDKENKINVFTELEY